MRIGDLHLTGNQAEESGKISNLQELKRSGESKPNEAGYNFLNHRLGKIPVAELSLKLDLASRPVGKQTVGGILRSRQFFFFQPHWLTCPRTGRS